jgi:SP family general alpha glucoside:H+ symporter-like MFS transporter
LGFVGTCLSWLLISKVRIITILEDVCSHDQFGRRTIYNSGMVLMTLLLFIIGFLDFGRSHSGAIWAQATLMDIWTFIYQMTVGPICFVIISEISATRLRGKTIAITTAVQAAASVIFTVAMPYMLNSDQANWRGKAGFLFGAVSLICFIWCWYRIPESRGRTFEELDILFEKKVPARHFANYDLLQSSEDAHLVSEKADIPV